MNQECGETLGDLEPVYDLLKSISEVTLAAGRFSYSETPRTPLLEGNSLHRRNKSVERP